MALALGSRLGPYEVTALIDSGGMGDVYRARDTKLGRDVALKVLPDLFADDPEHLARFQREARVLASLNHPSSLTGRLVRDFRSIVLRSRFRNLGVRAKLEWDARRHGADRAGGMSRRAHVRVAVACLFLWGTLDRPVSGQSTPTGRGQATRSVEAGPRERPTSVAVIPFTNISRHPGDTWLSLGIAETVTADLREQPGLSVIGPEQLWDGGWVDLGAVLAVDLGRQLGARWLVRGGYQRVGERIRITARLVDARDGTLIQAVKVDGPVSDIFAVQDRLVPELASGLALTAWDTGACGARAPRAVADRERRVRSC